MTATSSLHVSVKHRLNAIRIIVSSGLAVLVVKCKGGSCRQMGSAGQKAADDIRQLEVLVDSLKQKLDNASASLRKVGQVVGTSSDRLNRNSYARCR